MKLRCSQCRKAWIETSEANRCPACGFVLGSAVDEAALLAAGAHAAPSPPPGRDASPPKKMPEPPRKTGPSLARPSASTTRVPVATPAPKPAAHPAPPPPVAQTDDVEIEHAGELTFVSGAGAVFKHGIPEPVPGASTDGMDLGPEQGFLISLIDGHTSVDDIVAASGMNSMEAAAHFGVLVDLGLIRFRIEQPKEPPCRAPQAVFLPPSTAEAAPARQVLGRMEVKRTTIERKAAEEDPTEELDAAQACQAAGDYEQARAHAKAAWVIAPDDPRVALLDKQLNDPGYAKIRAQALHDLGVDAQKRNDLPRAIELYQRSLAEHEASAGVHHRLAIAMVNAKQPIASAESHLVRAVELAPDNATFAENLAKVHSRAKKAPGKPKG